MKAKEIITEIERLNAYDYEGGKAYLTHTPGGVKWKPLPGGSGLVWGTNVPNRGDMDPAADAEPFKPPFKERWEDDEEYAYRVRRYKREWEAQHKNGTLVGRLSLERYNGPFKNAWEVGTITVDEDRRGIGLAKALYGIVLTQLGATLVSGNSQTPGGRRNWLSLASIPGVEVKGILAIDDDAFGQKKALPKNADKYQIDNQNYQQRDAQETIELLMQLGFQYIGKQQTRWDGIRHFFAFDVAGGNGELKPAIKNKLSAVYGDYTTVLYAQWGGQ
jgi:GNAT superfamily N-acetyltransferase